MTQAQWQRVRDVFDRALEQSPDSVTAWLDIEAGDDPEVRAEVESLIAHYVRAGQFLATPIGERLGEFMPSHEGLVPGQIVGPYTIQAEVGRGGMGCVYRALDTRLGRVVALKALSPEWIGDPMQRERLRREARVAASLNHPGICTVYALEEFDGTLYIATELIEGRTLREEIRSGHRPAPERAMATARELAAALACAHDAGLVHRDLKPENVMRTPDGRLKILDFGLARPVHLDAATFAAPVTAVAAIVGTPASMAPEQLTGQPVDQRADVFALGVLLYEFVSGVHPFDAGSGLAVIGRILESEPKRIEDRVPAVPRSMAIAINRSLRKRPEDRYASAADVLQALDGVHEPVPTRPRRSEAMDGWWRGHQIAITVLYFVASGAAWRIKDVQGGPALILFVVVGVVAVIGGVLRGHLLFTASVHEAHLTAERARIEPITLATDLLLAATLAVAGWLAVADTPVLAVLTLGLAVGIGVTRVVVEPATARAAFDT